jgi:rhodanese-related sulfurtransferase
VPRVQPEAAAVKTEMPQEIRYEHPPRAAPRQSETRLAGPPGCPIVHDMTVPGLRSLADRRHLPLTLLLGLAIVLSAIAAASAVEGDAVWISPEAAQRAAAADEILLIDVRSPAEWQAAGVPEHARLVSIHDPDGMAGFGDKILAAAGGDRGRSIALICARGSRSARARDYLARLGFSHVFDVREGILGRGDAPGWLARGLPIRPCASC